MENQRHSSQQVDYLRTLCIWPYRLQHSARVWVQKLRKILIENECVPETGAGTSQNIRGVTLLYHVYKTVNAVYRCPVVSKLEMSGFDFLSCFDAVCSVADRAAGLTCR